MMVHYLLPYFKGLWGILTAMDKIENRISTHLSLAYYEAGREACFL